MCVTFTVQTYCSFDCGHIFKNSIDGCPRNFWHVAAMSRAAGAFLSHAFISLCGVSMLRCEAGS